MDDGGFAYEVIETPGCWRAEVDERQNLIIY